MNKVAGRPMKEVLCEYGSMANAVYGERERFEETREFIFETLREMARRQTEISNDLVGLLDDLGFAAEKWADWLNTYELGQDDQIKRILGLMDEKYREYNKEGGNA